MGGRIRQLAFLARNGSFTQMMSVLKSGRPGLWRNISRDEFELLFDQIQCFLSQSPSLMEFVVLALVSEARCFQKSTPAWLVSWLTENTHYDLSGYDLSGKQVWRQMFLPLVESRNNLADFCILVGTFTVKNNVAIIPDWAAPLFDEKSKEAVQTAEAAARILVPQASGSLVVYPLLAPTGRTQITGSSLGLPLALLFLSLLKKLALHPGVTATGRIDRAGEIHTTGGINQKLELAGSRGLKLFLTPSAPFLSPSGSQIKTSVVSTLDQAWFFAAWFSPGNSPAISTIREMMGSGRAFAENLARCDLGLLESAVRSNLMDRPIRELGQDSDAFKIFSNKILNMQDISHGQKTFLSSLIKVEDVTENKSLPADSAVKFITFLIHTANANGETKKCDELAARGIKCINDSQTILVETQTEFFNNQLVSSHNHYKFNPAHQALNFSKKLEDHYKSKVEMGSPIDPAYGAFCGTLSQHFGFCGPQFIKDFIVWHKKALHCFGRNLDSTGQYKTEWLRQYNYAVYAHLDAGMHTSAANLLCRYLEIEDLEEIIEKANNFSCWHHAVVARFFADTKNLATAGDYLNRVIPKIIPNPTHPWQLWYCNCARIAMNQDDPEKAEELFMKSIDICMAEKNGPAITIMALIPLYELSRVKDSKQIKDIESMEKAIRAAVSSLDKNHFSLLINAPTLEALFLDKQFSIKAMFPFSCR